MSRRAEEVAYDGQDAALAERQTAQAERLQAVQRRRRYVMWAGVVVLVAAGIGVAVGRPGSSSPSASGVQTFTGLSREHVSGPVHYPQTPPVGGAHAAVPQNCGIYDRPVPNENAVHSMEHGAVWITYRPGLAASAVTTLQADVRGNPYALLSPYPGLPSPVVASAWGKQLRVKSASDLGLADFVRGLANGPQAPEPGVACSGGVGTPQT